MILGPSNGAKFSLEYPSGLPVTGERPGAGRRPLTGRDPVPRAGPAVGR